jgi:hypothetical protein
MDTSWRGYCNPSQYYIDGGEPEIQMQILNQTILNLCYDGKAGKFRKMIGRIAVRQDLSATNKI